MVLTQRFNDPHQPLSHHHRFQFIQCQINAMVGHSILCNAVICISLIYTLVPPICLSLSPEENCTCGSFPTGHHCQFVCFLNHAVPCQSFLAQYHKSWLGALWVPWLCSTINSHYYHPPSSSSPILDITLCCDRSSCIATWIPVGIWVIRTALSVVLTCWPPAPDAR